MPTPKGLNKTGLPSKIAAVPGKAAGMSRHGMRWIVAAVLLLVAFLLGYTLGAIQVSRSYEQGLSAGWEKAKTAIADSGLLPSSETMTLNGTVSSVGSDYIEISVAQTVFNPLESPASLTRKVMIDADTEITKAIPLTAEERAAAEQDLFDKQEAYFAAVNAGQDVEPPNFNIALEKTEAFSLSDVEEGMAVTVTAEQDISVAGSFTASKIQVIESTATPAGAPPAPIKKD